MYVCIYIYIYRHIVSQVCPRRRPRRAVPEQIAASLKRPVAMITIILATFYPFSQFREINISLLSLQNQPNTAPNLFQRGVEHGKYDNRNNSYH